MSVWEGVCLGVCLYGRIRVCLGVWVDGCVSEIAYLSVCVCEFVCLRGWVVGWVCVSECLFVSVCGVVCRGSVWARERGSETSDIFGG